MHRIVNDEKKNRKPKQEQNRTNGEASLLYRLNALATSGITDPKIIDEIYKDLSKTDIVGTGSDYLLQVLSILFSNHQKADPDDISRIEAKTIENIYGTKNINFFRSQNRINHVLEFFPDNDVFRNIRDAIKGKQRFVLDSDNQFSDNSLIAATSTT